MAIYDQQLAKILEAGGPAAATADPQLNNDLDSAFRARHGYSQKADNTVKPRIAAHSTERLSKSQKSASKALQAPPRRKQPRKSLFVDASRISIKTPQELSAEATRRKRLAALPQTKQGRVRMAQRLLRQGLSLRQAHAVMQGKAPMSEMN